MSSGLGGVVLVPRLSLGLGGLLGRVLGGHIDHLVSRLDLFGFGSLGL